MAARYGQLQAIFRLFRGLLPIPIQHGSIGASSSEHLLGVGLHFAWSVLGLVSWEFGGKSDDGQGCNQIVIIQMNK